MNPRRIAVALGIVLGSGSVALAQATTRVSVGSSGVQADGVSIEPSISADGRFVAFVSRATNLVAGDTNGFDDVFVIDRATGLIERVSVDSFLVEGNGHSSEPSISADGRIVAFQSYASNLVAGDTNDREDVFVHDRSNGATERVSVDSSGAEGDWGGYRARLSMDGTLVAFGSHSSNLVAGDTNGVDDAFVHDRSTGITERVSVDSLGAEGDSASYGGSISSDGEVVVFASYATNLVSDDTNGVKDVFVHDRSTGLTERVSVDSSGNEANDDSDSGDFSADDRIVAFASRASNLDPSDTNSSYDVFVHDRWTGVTELVSVDSSGTKAASGIEPVISADGQWVAFSSGASNLVAGDTNNFTDVFVRDRTAGLTVRVSVTSSGAQGIYGHSSAPAISADGRSGAFTSWATNLVAGDTNALGDVFVHGRYLTLEADPPSPGPGAALAFTTWTGEPSAASLLVVTNANGAPVFIPVVLGSFDAVGEWIWSATVPPGLSGITIDCETFGFVATGKIDVSSPFTIAFQ
jgi:Tol biopolymer transport system component